MKTNFEIIKTKDYQGDKCYKINYIEYDTLYTMPEPHYTKKAANEKLREIKSAATLGRKGGSSKSDKKIAASRENGKLGGRPKKEGNEMENMINNLINGNLADAKKQAKRFRQSAIMQYCVDNGFSFEKSVAMAMYLKNQIDHQQYCDAV